MHWISIILGLAIAWVILAFIGPKPRAVSYYTQAPVVGASLDELDKIMEAVGLAPSRDKAEKSVADIELVQGVKVPPPAPTQPMAPAPTQPMTPAPQPVPVGQGTPASPQAFSPAPAMAPSPQ